VPEDRGFQDPYLDESGRCLRNKPGITDPDELREFEYLAAAGATAAAFDRAAGQRRRGVSFDLAFWCGIHRDLFKDVYDWAGEPRTVNISKGDTHFLPADRIGMAADYAFKQLSREGNLKWLPMENFCERAAHHFSEFNHIHPFREGNGRAQRVLFDVIAQNAGYRFNWSKLDRDRFIAAVIERASRRHPHWHQAGADARRRAAIWRAPQR
jgi:cell filamentation protein